LVDTLPDPILACDAQGRIILTNFPAATLLQVSPAQALRQRVVNVVTDAPILELFDLLQKTPIPAAPHNGDPLPIQQEIRLFRGGQRLIYQALAARTLDKGVLLVFRDVSRLTGATQMKADFVANASHELRTPIAAIKIAFETLRDVLAEDDLDQADRCLAIIDGHLHRLEEMLRDLLDLSRVESPMLETDARPVNTGEMFANLRATLGVMARQKNVTLQLDEASVPQFTSDARLLNLILKNLVENSLKFTPAGGSVSVRVAAAPDEQLSITVADTGIGIAPEHVDRVFERFYQVDAARSGSAGRGTGLGLAIVKHAVLAMKGHITLQSVPGKGTTVTCRFPQGDGVLEGEERE
jgi:two-component system, OmpR family, phosphate regulon sensor histidine kinase PhoR